MSVIVVTKHKAQKKISTYERSIKGVEIDLPKIEIQDREYIRLIQRARLPNLN